MKVMVGVAGAAAAPALICVGFPYILPRFAISITAQHITLRNHIK